MFLCRENLDKDTYLLSQMDTDQYVSIATIAGFNQVRRLTRNIDLIKEILRGLITLISHNVVQMSVVLLLCSVNSRSRMY